mgnify:CR=1 FL=1
MLLEEIKQIKSTKKELRSFGLVMGVALGIIAGLLYWFEKPNFDYVLYAGLGVALLGLAVPVVLKPFQKIWMTFAVIMGWFMTRLILSILYFLVFTPIALIGKLVGKKFLDTSWGTATNTYWVYRDNMTIDKTRYEQQF